MSNRIWILATAIICIAIIALGVVVGISPNFASSARSELDRAAVVGQNNIYEADLARLKEQFETIDEIKEELAGLQKSLPAGAETANFVRAIGAAAALTGVTLVNYTQEAPVVYGAFNSGDGAGTEETAAINGGTLLGIPVSQSVSSVDFIALLNFVSELQQGTRLFVVTSLKLTVEEIDGAQVGTLVVTGYIYTLADPDAQTDAVPPPTDTETPAPTDTPLPTETPESTETPTP